MSASFFQYTSCKRAVHAFHVLYAFFSGSLLVVAFVLISVYLVPSCGSILSADGFFCCGDFVLDQEDELMSLLAAKAHPICYDGFEPSGRMHIAQGVMRVINVNKLTK